MDNNNNPHEPNLNWNNNEPPQQPFFTTDNQPPYNGYDGHHRNPQNNNPFTTPMNNYVPGSDPAAHKKGIISTVCGIVSILLTLIALIATCSCLCNCMNSATYYDYNSMVSSGQLGVSAVVVSSILIVIAAAAAVVGIIMAALGKKTSNDPLLTAGLVLSIIGAVLVFLLFVACACTCACTACTANSATSGYSTYSDLERIIDGL